MVCNLKGISLENNEHTHIKQKKCQVFLARQAGYKHCFNILGKVLQSARFFMTTHRFSVYVKSGGAKQAELDFESINPTMLRDDTVRVYFLYLF